MDETLAENLKTKQLEELEFNAIDAILPSLLEQHLMTDMECRVIAGHNQLLEKQGAVDKLIMSKTKEEASHLAEIFRTSTCHADELSKTSKTSDSKDEQENNLPQDKPNPLLNNTVLACLFEYLPLEDIKQSRFVCLKWNSVAEIFLRKRCTIHFHPDNLRAEIFMEVSKYSLPDLPFPAYKFTGVDYARCEDHIENFFDKWGKHIKEVELVALDTTHPRIYDITPWITKTPNLCSLKIGCAPDNAEILFSISIDKLSTLKTVSLENCRILINDGDRVTFLPFSNVSLIDVSFQRLGNIEVLQDFCCNDVFDFSQTINLVVSYNKEQENVKFDMEGQICNKNQLNLHFVPLKNWTKAKGDVNLLTLSGFNFTERNDLKVTSMIIDNSNVNLSALPQTLEKLRFGEAVNIVGRESFELPNLKYLGFIGGSDDSRMLGFLIENCPNLTEMELFGATCRVCAMGLKLDLDSIPRSVKKLRMGVIGLSNTFEFANTDQVLEIDSLLLESIEKFSDCKIILERIKPKVLVLSYYKLDEPHDTSDILEIILANKQIGTIVVGTLQDNIDLYDKTPFERSTFSSYVDKKSNYYKFENQVGHAIELKEYEKFNTMIAGMDDGYFAKLTTSF